MSQESGGPLASASRVVDRLVHVAPRRRIDVVVGQLRQVGLEVCCVQPFQRLADLAMQTYAARSAELPVECVAERRVSQFVGAAADRALTLADCV